MGAVPGWGFWPRKSHVWVNAAAGGLGGLNWPEFTPACPSKLHLEFKQVRTHSPYKAPCFPGTGGASVAWTVIVLVSKICRNLLLDVNSRVLHVWLLYACHIVHCKNIPFICLLILLLKLYCQLIFNSYKGWGRVNWNLWSHLLYFLCPCIVFRALFPWPQKSQYESKREEEKKPQPEFIFVVVKGLCIPAAVTALILPVDQSSSQMHEEGVFTGGQLMVGRSPAVCLG